jgi:SpoVK/Ycf46/Vps4 family AAA+-type ATPase
MHQMDDIQQLPIDLVQLARLSLAGRRQDIEMYIRRLARRYAKSNPAVVEPLLKLLQGSPSQTSPMRNAEVATIPVDQDSRLQLVRFESPVELDIEPIWRGEVRRLLEQFLAERTHETNLISAGISPSRSMLFHGAPGVGKTLAAKWLARALGRPLVTLDLSAVMSSFLGRTGINVRHVLDYAKGVECVLMLDELDAIAKRRDDISEVGELKRLVTVILQEIDDWPERGILLAGTNHASLLDPAVWRRFDVVIEFPMPNPAESERAIREFLGDDNAQVEPMLKALSVVLDGLSFSEIERQIMQARREAIVSHKSIESILEILIGNRTKELPLKTRKQIAFKLYGLGYSQRRVHQMTGISRDTLRNMDKERKE